MDFANQNELIIPIVAILMPIGIIAVVSYFKSKEREMIHRERMLAMEKGLQPPPEPEQSFHGRERGPRNLLLESGPRNLLLRGLIFLFIGIGAFVSMNWFRMPWTDHMVGPFGGFVTLPLLAFISIAVGLAYLVYYAIEGHKQNPPAE